MVEERQAEAGRPAAAALTEEALRESTLDEPASLTALELLFTSFSSLPALASCTQLRELTIMSARLQRVPPEVAMLSNSLRSLCLATNEISCIENLHLMPCLLSLQLQENRLSRVSGLEGCPSLRRLWLSANQIGRIGGLHSLSELRELWLQSNPIESVGAGLAQLQNLQVLSLAATRISRLEQLRPLQAMRPILMALHGEGGAGESLARHFYQLATRSGLD